MGSRVEGGCWKGNIVGRQTRVGVFWLHSQLLSVDSLEYHSSMIADAVKKVIKVGKVSSEGFKGSALCYPVLLRGPAGPLSSRPPQYAL